MNYCRSKAASSCPMPKVLASLLPVRVGAPPGGSSSAKMSNKIRTLERLNAGHDSNVVVRVDTDLPPEGLRQAAEHAAHSGDLRSTHPADLAAHRTRGPPGTSSGCGTRATETARNPSLRQAPSIPQLPPSRPVAPFSPHLKWVPVLFCPAHPCLCGGRMHHLAVVAVVPGSGAGRWSVGCGAAGVVEVNVLLASL